VSKKCCWVCDVCGKEARVNPDGVVKEPPTDWMRISIYRRSIDLCPVCAASVMERIGMRGVGGEV